MSAMRLGGSTRAWIVLIAVTAALGAGCGGDDGGQAADAAAGADADGPGAADAGDTADANELRPESLEETGLYADFSAETLADGVVEFTPQFVLWTDGATKKRWVKLPAGTTIDTSDMDFWTFPVGTKLWKEFTRDGTRVETRLLAKISSSEWYMMAYVWNQAQTEALASPSGASDVLGTNHDVPSQGDCAKCHSRMPDVSLGFTAIQLDHSGNGTTMGSLVADNSLSDPPNGNAPYFALPGTAADQAALGYLHANCGGCHHAQSDVLDVVPVQLRLEVGKLNKVTSTPTYVTAYDTTSALTPIGPGIVKLIDPAGKDTSVVWQRMNRRGMKQMPPLGTEDLDDGVNGGLAEVGSWIDGL